MSAEIFTNTPNISDKYGLSIQWHTVVGDKRMMSAIEILLNHSINFRVKYFLILFKNAL